MFRRVAVLIAFVATTGSAATGPEFAVSTAAAAPAAYSQTAPSVASNGNDYFAVWLDSRSSTYPFVYQKPALYGSAVGSAGQFADPFGRKIADGIYSARVASNGRTYLVVHSDYDGNTVARRINDDGTAGPPSQYIWPGFVYALASNGDGFCALLTNSAQSTFAVILFDANGIERGPGIDPGSLRQPVLVSTRAGYRIVDVLQNCDTLHPCTSSIRLTSIDSSTRQIASHVLIAGLPEYTFVSALAASDRLYIATAYTSGNMTNRSAARVIATLSTDLDGNNASPLQQLASSSTQCLCTQSGPLLAWDGVHVLVGWTEPADNQPPFPTQRAVVAMRVNPDGSPFDAEAFSITTAVQVDFSAATSASGVLLVSDEYRRPVPPYWGPSDVYARRVRSFDEFITAPPGASHIASAPAQFDAAAAVSGVRTLVAWREFEQPSAVAAAVIATANPLAVSPIILSPRSNIEKRGVSVAALRDMGLVAWLEETDSDVTVFAQRIGLDGVPRDPQPVVIAHDTKINGGRGITSVATDGSQFFLVWNFDDKVLGVRILPDGTFADKEPIVVSRDSGFTFARIDPRVVWTGESFLVIWSEDWYCHCLLISPPPPPRTIVRTARVGSDGALLPAGDTSTLVDQIGAIAEVGIARNGGSLMAAWSSGNDDPMKTSDVCVHTLPLDLEGRALAASATQLGCETLDNIIYPGGDVNVVAKDSGFAVFRSSMTTNDISAVLLTADGTVTRAFALSAAQTTWAPAAVATPFGTLVLYSRIANDPQYGGVSRLFGRMLDAVASPKSRAIRH